MAQFEPSCQLVHFPLAQLVEVVLVSVLIPLESQLTTFDLVVFLLACLVVTVPLIGRKVLDFVARKRFERMVDRVGAAQ